jgi:hypothetical protein
MSNADTKPKIVTKTVTKPALTGLGDNLQVKLVEHSAYEYVRLFVGEAGGEIPFELIYHRPIGYHKVPDGFWVTSTPADMALLLTREKSPNEKELLILRNTHKKELAVAANLITLSADGAVRYPGTSGTDRNAFLKPHRDAAQKAVKDANAAIQDWKKADKKSRPSNSPLKLTVNNELLRILRALVNDKNAQAELLYSEHMSKKEVNDKAEAQHPDIYQTMKGPYADTPQVAVDWTKDLSKEGLQQEIAKYIAILSGRRLKNLGSKVAAAFTIHKFGSKCKENANQE